MRANPWATMPASGVRPDLPVEQQPVIGLIGMGGMGRLYARVLSEAGWRRIYVCDQPQKYESLKDEFKDNPSLRVMPDGHAVSRASDFILYSVEAEFIGRVVAQYGPSTKEGAVVAGQTSVKAPEKEAFETHLPPDTHIVSCHSLHGPTVSSVGQPLILIKHRAPDWALKFVESILRPFKSRYVYLSYDEHDLITSNTQAVTHAAFLSMGTAWCSRLGYPWEQGQYIRGIETVKVNLTLRIYSNLWHVYAGLAILNPHARVQIHQYAKSATELYKLMLLGSEAEAELRRRVEWAREAVFEGALEDLESPKSSSSSSLSGDGTTNGHANGKTGKKPRRPILLSEDILDKFSLAPQDDPLSPTSASAHQKPNSHLSLLAMVDCWAHLRINPFHHLALAATPIFRLFLGVAEHLFLNRTLLESAVHSALHDTWHRADDLEFVVAARGWSQCVSFGSFEVYRKRFEGTRVFFEQRFEEANVLGSRMIQAIMADEARREAELTAEG